MILFPRGTGRARLPSRASSRRSLSVLLLVGMSVSDPGGASGGELSPIQGVPQPVRSAPLQATLERVVSRRVETNRPRLAPEQVRVAVIDLADPQQPLFAEHRGT